MVVATMAPVANGFSGDHMKAEPTSHDIITISERVSHARQNVRKEEMSAKKGVPLIIDNGKYSEMEIQRDLAHF